MIKNNRIVVDLNKVQYAALVWKNQTGKIRVLKPTKPTVFGEYIPDDMAPEVNGWPRETMFMRAQRRKLFDVWTPACHLKLQANGFLIYTGKKAMSIWKEWNRRQFGKNKS